MSDKIKFCKNCRNNMTPNFYGYMPNSKDICPVCKNKVVEINLTDEDYWIIRHVSKDVNFLEAMIKLHNDDIIEYQTKMSQFRANDQCYQEKHNNQKQNSSNIPKCPTCGSTNIEKISVGKKMKGSFLFGVLSSDVRNTMYCKNCGYKW